MADVKDQSRLARALQVVVPDDVAIQKGGTVTFIVNGPGHGIALYPVSGRAKTRAKVALTIGMVRRLVISQLLPKLPV